MNRTLRLLRAALVPLCLLACLLGAAIPQPASAQVVRTYVAYVGAYSGSTAYNLNDMVLSGSTVYISLTYANAGNTPSTSPSFCQQRRLRHDQRHHLHHRVHLHDYGYSRGNGGNWPSRCGWLNGLNGCDRPGGCNWLSRFDYLWWTDRYCCTCTAPGCHDGSAGSSGTSFWRCLKRPRHGRNAARNSVRFGGCGSGGWLLWKKSRALSKIILGGFERLHRHRNGTGYHEWADCPE
jgi:hypothetical protein